MPNYNAARDLWNNTNQTRSFDQILTGDMPLSRSGKAMANIAADMWRGTNTFHDLTSITQSNQVLTVLAIADHLGVTSQVKEALR